MALGTDFAGVTDIDPGWREATSARRALAEAVGRRLTTPLGQLPDYPTYGFDVSSLIGSTLTDSTIRQRVRAQCLAEEEVTAAKVTVTRSGEALDIEVQLVDGDGPFELTLSVDALTTSVIIPETI